MPDSPSSPEVITFDVSTIEEMTAYLPSSNLKMAACGGMGAVYKAYQESLDRWVAVKILPPKFGAEKEFADRFKSEARAMAKLNHTNIVGVYDFGITSGGHLFLVIEWVEGNSLHDVIHAGSLSLRKATNLAIQLCEALTFAHEHQIIHRDIKPGNIMVNDADHVKVADFGLARPVSDEAEEENPMGTPDYAAPEIRGGSVIDHRVDIFAAGVVLYEMLTGTTPGEEYRSVTEFTDVSPRWDQIIGKAIHPDPDQRYQEAGEFRAHINVAMKQEAAGGVMPVMDETAGGMFAAAKSAAVAPQQPSKPQPRPQPRPKMSQGQQLAVIGGTIGVVVVAVLALIMWRPAGTSPPALGTQASPDEIREIVATLEQKDRELARMVNSFAQDWLSSGADKNLTTAEKLRAAQTTVLEAKLRERRASARRAEVIAAELEKLETAPSLKNLKKAVE
ncbi:MAG: serine/threonine-protein kinase [Prosthecobacter sp.]